MNIMPEQFYDFLVKNIDKYSEDVQKAVIEETKEVSKGIKPEIQSYSVKGGQLYKSGDYRAGWKATTLTKNGVYKRKVYNENKPTLVHLLEFGHNGPIQAKPYPHVRKTEIKYSEILFNKLKERINKL